MTLNEFLLKEQRRFPKSTGNFTALFSDLVVAAKIVSKAVNHAGLISILGATGDTNVQGEAVQKLDEHANDAFTTTMLCGGHLAGMASEEVEGVITIPSEYPKGGYLLLFDPLDGSSNIDVNISVGTIFSILKAPQKEGALVIDDFLQPGTEQVCAGYVLYGSSTMLVYTTGHGVHGFTLDPTLGEFMLSHEDIRIPSKGDTYSINEGNSKHWHEGTTNYIAKVKEDGLKARYVGSLVADFHRNLLKGGVFLYPGDTQNPRGKLRLLYEANPMAFIVEAAGGAALSGTCADNDNGCKVPNDTERTLEVIPTELHQRVPLIIGSTDNVEEAASFYPG